MTLTAVGSPQRQMVDNGTQQVEAAEPGYSAEEFHKVQEERDHAQSQLNIVERSLSMAESDNESLRMEVAALSLARGGEEELRAVKDLLEKERERGECPGWTHGCWEASVRWEARSRPCDCA